MTDDSLNDSANNIGDMYKDGSSSHGDDSYASQRNHELQYHEGRASEDGESMDAPTLQADAALALAKQFQKARCAGAAEPDLLPSVQQESGAISEWLGLAGHALYQGHEPLRSSTYQPPRSESNTVPKHGRVQLVLRGHVRRAAEHDAQQTLSQDSLKPRTRMEELGDL